MSERKENIMSDLKDAHNLAVDRYRRNKFVNYTNNIDEPIKLNFENPKEDRSVLNAINIFKIINWIVFSIGAAISIRMIIRMSENEIIVEVFAFQILVSLFVHWIIHIFFCWSRGIYRNVAWIASSTHLKENDR